jgi:steroid delta-isomerase-like uncharacterized protein
MGNEQNEQVARRGLEVFNSGDLSVVDDIIAPDATSHDPAQPEDAHGPDGFKQIVETYRTAFPDLKFTIDECFSDGDLVCMRWSTSGTHDGDLMGIAPTGKSITSSGISIDKVQDGKIVESWVQWDNMGLMAQLGLLGEPAGAAAG